jgi:putative ubiquitin-RnfH superfamily antitoxin RatB of RatAB toxin-antitoxin module
MIKLFTVLLSSALVFGASIPVLAGGPKTPWINNREHRQQVRIRHGYRSDDLSAREALRLQMEQARIRLYERRARADGQVTMRERLRLHRELNQSSRHIRRQRND